MDRLLFHLLFYLGALIGMAGTATAASRAWSLTTDAKLESVAWPQAYGEDTNNTLNRLSLIPTLSGKYGSSYRFYIKPNFQWDPENKSPGERIFFDPGEAYFRLRGESTNLQVGYNIFNWGVTDGYNPMDVVNTRQYFDPLRPVKLGAPSLILSHSLGNSEQELIYIPKNTKSLLPGEKSRWLPRKIFIPESADNDTILLLPENINYSFEHLEPLNRALDHNLGLRLQWHLGNIDLSFTGFQGAAGFPLIQPVVTGTVVQISPKIILQTDPDVILRTMNYRQRVGGFSWVSSQGGFLLKYATNYSQSLGDHPLLPGWTHENILGVEKQMSLGSEGLLIAILQYSYTNTERASDSNLSVSAIFRRAWMAGGRFSWGDSWTLTALGLYDSIHFSHFQQYSVARRFFDIWTLQLGAEFISGSPSTPLGVYTENDNYRLSLSRSF